MSVIESGTACHTGKVSRGKTRSLPLLRTKAGRKHSGLGPAGTAGLLDPPVPSSATAGVASRVFQLGSAGLRTHFSIDSVLWLDESVWRYSPAGRRDGVSFHCPCPRMSHHRRRWHHRRLHRLRRNHHSRFHCCQRFPVLEKEWTGDTGR